ncbi:MAG: PadR family transcriptional regulator [Actinomycetota bacterium]|nr:PadR family transcriptional regulator [Actinomycetota bacterium]
MSLDCAVLGFLSTDDLSGYDLKTRCFDEAIPHFWTADQAQIYRTLDRLERAGRVSVRRQRQTGRPDRKVYSITRAGREALAEWAGQPHGSAPFRDPLLIQLYFAADIPPQDLVDVLVAQREEHQARLDSLRSRAATFMHEYPHDGERTIALRRMTFEAAMTSERATIDWLDNCIDTLQAQDDIPEGAQRSLFGNAKRTGRKTQ